MVTRADTGEELLHEYCAYYVGVRPTRVTNLRLEGSTVKWSWDEHSFDLASPGAVFERELAIDSGGRLVWAGDVVRTPNPKPQPPQPPAAPVEQRLLQSDVRVKDEWKSEYGQERVRVIVTHARSGTELVWDSEKDGSCWADSQSVRGLGTAQVDDYVRVDFVMETSGTKVSTRFLAWRLKTQHDFLGALFSGCFCPKRSLHLGSNLNARWRVSAECGSSHAFNMSKFVKLGAAGIEWAKRS